MDQREQFDKYDPPAESWDEVRKHLPQTAKRRSLHRPLLAVAASVALIVAAFFIVQTTRTNDLDTVALDQELVAVDRQYAQQIALAQTNIDQRQGEIKKLLANYPELEGRFQVDLGKLSQTYLKLKKDLPYNANQEILLKAMISNLKLQIDVLENQLSIIENIKSTVNDETSNSI